MDAEMAKAPEIMGTGAADRVVYVQQCSQEVNAMYTKIWNNLLK